MTKHDHKQREAFELTWRFDAAPERVFRAWTDPAELGWFFNDTMPVPSEPIEVDLRVGGAWRQMMIINEDTRYMTGGIYREIVPGRKLKFAWGAVGGWPEISPDRLDDGPLITLEFKPSQGGTELVTTVDLPHSMSEPEARQNLFALVRAGWAQTVDRLVGYLQ